MGWAILAQFLSMTVCFKNRCRSRKTFASYRDRVSYLASHVPMSLICHQVLECVGRLQQNREQSKSFRSLTEIFGAST
jgi:hypothetical protein